MSGSRGRVLDVGTGGSPISFPLKVETPSRIVEPCYTSANVQHTLITMWIPHYSKTGLA